MNQLLTLLAAYWNQCIAHAETHCWNCNRAITEADWHADLCPHCGKDLIPF